MPETFFIYFIWDLFCVLFCVFRIYHSGRGMEFHGGSVELVSANHHGIMKMCSTVAGNTSRHPLGPWQDEV